MLRLRVTMLRLDVTLLGVLVVEDKRYVAGWATVLPEDDKQEPIQAYFTPPKNRNYNAKWLLLWQDETGMSMQEQAEMEQPLTQTEYRVRDWLIGEIGIGNYVFVNQAEVGRKLRIARSHVSVAIKRLLKLGILLQGPKSGRSNTYMVNPAFCFSGSLSNGLKERNKAISEGRAKILDFNCINIS